jgi:methylated-DNA-protein-cysteine methyltransferase-like protein
MPLRVEPTGSRILHHFGGTVGSVKTADPPDPMNRPRKDTQAPDTEDSFYRSVWTVVRDIPRGHVLTYGEVARLAGRRSAARRVSQALRRAPRRLELPWHRVINAQGRISFPEDSPAFTRQRALLEDEGVEFRRGRIDLDRYGYRGAVDQMLWGDPAAL